MFLALRSASDLEEEDDFGSSALVFKGKSRDSEATDDFDLAQLNRRASSDEEIAMVSVEVSTVKCIGVVFVLTIVKAR